MMELYSALHGVAGVGSVLGAGLVLFGAIFLVRATRSRPAWVILTGAILATLAPIGTLGLGLLVSFSVVGMDSYGVVYLILRLMTALAWILVGLGMTMLGPLVGGWLREKEALERIMEDRQGAPL